MIIKRLKNCVNNHGFTLIELMISLVLTLLVLSGVYNLFISQTKAYGTQNQVVEMQQNVRIAMDLITQNIRSAGYDPRNSGDFGFTNSTFSASDTPPVFQITDMNSLFLTMNDNGDTTIDLNVNERIGYRLNGGNLQISTAINAGTGFVSTWTDLAENIYDLTFTYTFANGDTAVIPDNNVVGNNISDIRIVQVSISGHTSKRDPSWNYGGGEFGVGYRTRTLTSNIKPRNYE